MTRPRARKVGAFINLLVEDGFYPNNVSTYVSACHIRLESTMEGKDQ